MQLGIFKQRLEKSLNADVYYGNCVGHTSTGNLVGLLRCIFLLKFLVCGEYKLEKRLDIRPEIQYPAIRYPEIGLDINSDGRTAGKISIRCDLDLFSSLVEILQKHFCR